MPIFARPGLRPSRVNLRHAHKNLQAIKRKVAKTINPKTIVARNAKPFINYYFSSLSSDA